MGSNSNNNGNYPVILNPQLEPSYREYWGLHLPIALERARPVLQSECHVLRYFQVPDDRQAQFTAAGGYRQTTLALEPGSFVLGFQQLNDGGVGGALQVTDIPTQHKLFSQPYPSTLLVRNGVWLLPTPMPVTAPGTLLIELYAQTSGEVSLVMVVAELDKQYAVGKGCLAHAN